MVQAYTFTEKDDFSKKGIAVVTNYLKSLEQTVSVENVENDTRYQREDIDLIWKYRRGVDDIVNSIEVKTDRYTTGNFWLETGSNEEMQTTGCFVKSKADFFFYYFTKWDRLYIIPMQKAQAWFVTNMERFEESRTTTKDENGQHSHTTVGRKVPISVMRQEVKDIKVVENVSRYGSSSSLQPQL
jgi:hypothetical protein